MAVICPNNCYFNQETLHLKNPSSPISPKSSFNLNHHHPNSYSSFQLGVHPHSQYPLHGKHQLRNQCFRVTNEMEEDSFKNNPISKYDEKQGLGVKAALSMLSFYKREISPILPKSCRYVPSCSEYSMIAYKKYGVAKGTVLTAWRLCRCNPLGYQNCVLISLTRGSGFDPPRWFDEPKPSEE